MVDFDESPNKDIFEHQRINVNQPTHVDKFPKKNTPNNQAFPHSQGPKVGVQMILQLLAGCLLFLGGEVGGVSSLRTENMAKQCKTGILKYSSDMFLNVSQVFFLDHDILYAFFWWSDVRPSFTTFLGVMILLFQMMHH